MRLRLLSGFLVDLALAGVAGIFGWHPVWTFLHARPALVWDRHMIACHVACALEYRVHAPRLGVLVLDGLLPLAIAGQPTSERETTHDLRGCDA
jgi:hypothetical protein